MGTEMWFLAALLNAAPAKDEAAEISATEQLIAKLLELQHRVRGGELVPLEELALGATTREEILHNFDVRGALRLGVEPSAVRDRLLPGFAAELEQLANQRARMEAGPPKESSPLLVLLLDFEVELRATADRRRQGLGLKSPLDVGPLGSPLQPNGAPGPATVNGVDVTAPRNTINPLLAAAALYRAGRWQESVDSWERAPADSVRTPEMEHQRADSLLRVGRVDDAIDIWAKLITDHKESSWAEQAAFSLEVARTLSALQKASAAADGAKR
ncbi:MAG: hypothetical protein EXS13_07150 [Planctomycetes bacterium]|nr:hypothetical protein [Planctomycetota bacterium]